MIIKKRAQMSDKFVSIVMPTFNSTAFLQDALDSLTIQANQSFELLVCDGGSTDGTLDLIRSKIGDKAKIVSHSDNGVPDALNKGFSSARGEILCWLNSDDVYISKNSLSIVSRSFADPDQHVAICDSVTLNKDGEVSKTLISFSPQNKIPSSSGNIFTGSLFFSKSAWQDFGGFSCKYKLAFEYELTDFIFSNYNARKINSIVGGFRIHEAGLSSAFSSKMQAELQELRLENRNTPRGSQKIHRLRQHCVDRNLFRVIRNKFNDPNCGLHWKDIERDGWIGLK
jgi:glycosyltransferase involved in cell wall biosynthesis